VGVVPEDLGSFYLHILIVNVESSER
jgi:hypothetical protein